MIAVHYFKTEQDNLAIDTTPNINETTVVLLQPSKSRIAVEYLSGTSFLHLEGWPGCRNAVGCAGGTLKASYRRSCSALRRAQNWRQAVSAARWLSHIQAMRFAISRRGGHAEGQGRWL